MIASISRTTAAIRFIRSVSFFIRRRLGLVDSRSLLSRLFGMRNFHTCRQLIPLGLFPIPHSTARACPGKDIAMPAEKNPAVIYLGPACQEQADGREWCKDDVWERCECGDEPVRYVIGAEFDRVTAEREALQLLLNERDEQVHSLEQRRHAEQQACQAAERRVDELEAALKFYADREHYHFESGNWDTVSGEPLNILWCGDEPDFVEDGTVARAALNPTAEAESQSTIPGYDPRSQCFQTS